jgi:hypothetical protein
MVDTELLQCPIPSFYTEIKADTDLHGNKMIRVITWYQNCHISKGFYMRDDISKVREFIESSRKEMAAQFNITID